MRGSMFVIAAGLALVAAAGPALAQGGMNAACVNQVNGAYDAIASQDWQQKFQSSDQQAIRQVAGVWYTETQAQGLNMVAHQWQSFQPNQIFDYKTTTCDGVTGGCSDAFGTGMYAAQTMPDGSLFVTTNFSDNNRSNACSGGYVRFPNPNVMETSSGAVWQRAQ